MNQFVQSASSADEKFLFDVNKRLLGQVRPCVKSFKMVHNSFGGRFVHLFFRPMANFLGRDRLYLQCCLQTKQQR